MDAASLHSFATDATRGSSIMILASNDNTD